jgi:hypothetical protein
MDPKLEDFIQIQKSDLISAWTALENIACSLDQIGGAYNYMDKDGKIFNEREYRAVCKALHDYFTSGIWRQINEVRMRLRDYISDEEAEWLSENKIQYWNDMED